MKVIFIKLRLHRKTLINILSIASLGIIFGISNINHNHVHADINNVNNTNVNQSGSNNTTTTTNSGDNTSANSSNSNSNDSSNNDEPVVQQKSTNATSLGSSYNPNYHKESNAYDISQWQGYITNNQARQLKREVNFMILRAQAGNYKDTEIDHNEKLMDANHIPYGVYSYSYYTSPYNAKVEADELYHRSPYANFYANDIEENNAGYSLNQATQWWADEMHRLTRKPVVLYSDNYFLTSELNRKTWNHYDAIWDAAYGEQPDPPFHYDLWQDTSAFYSKALGQRVDADVFPVGYNKPLSYWTGGKTSYRRYHNHYITHHHTYKPVHHYTYKPKFKHHTYTPVIHHRSHKGIFVHNIYLKQISDYYDGKISNLKHGYHMNLDTSRQDMASVKSALKRVNNIKSFNKRNHYYSRMNERHINNLIDILNKKYRTFNSIYKKNFNYLGHYYRYNKIHELEVTWKPKICLYSLRTGRHIGNAYRGSRIKVLYFIYHLTDNGWMTRAVGYYHGHTFMFTSNKNCVKWI